MADAGSDGGADADADSDSDSDADANAADGVALTPREVMGPAWSSAVTGVAYNLRGVVPGASRASFGSDTFGGVAEAAAATAAAAAAAAETRRVAAGSFDRRALPRLLRWVDAVPCAFLTEALALDSIGARSWRDRLRYDAHERLGSLRVSEFFDVIVEFPDSRPAVDDLRRCLRRTTLHAKLTSSLRRALSKRLLIAGAPTTDIIEQYRLTIRALRALDPSGVVLRVVSGPLKEYLRERKDTIRCVVTMLMGDGGGGGGEGGDGGDGADGTDGADGGGRLGLLEGGDERDLDEDADAFDDDESDEEEEANGDDAWARVGGLGREPRRRGASSRDADATASAASDAGDAWELDPEFAEEAAGGTGGAPRGPGGDRDPSAPATPAARSGGTTSGWDSWEPEPVESEAASSRGRRRRVADELGHLVAIYGSKELFINEYRNMLADRLLSKVGYDVDRETRALELLKLRFGESSLHKCEVMLKDVNDSKRINGNVKAPPAPGTPAARDVKSTETLRRSPLDATIVSALFWPPFANEAPDFELPPAMRAMTDAYERRYHHLKAPRVMRWKPALGTVRVEAMFGEIEVEVDVGPIEAAVLFCFQRKRSWELSELASELKAPQPVVRRKTVTWINRGLLVEVKDAREGGGGGAGYRLATKEDAREAAFGAAATDESAGAGGAVASAEEQAAAGMKVYEQYVVGMLTNFPSLPLDRIHNMLKMFVSEPPYDKSEHQLEAFLAQLVAEDKVVLEGNQYKRKSG